MFIVNANTRKNILENDWKKENTTTEKLKKSHPQLKFGY